MVRRLIGFLLILLALLTGLEVFVSFKEDSFAALSDRFLLREQLIRNASDETELILLGTSRLLDAVDQEVFSGAYETKTGEDLKCFNASLAGVNVEILEIFAETVSRKEGVKTVLIEASTPSLTQQPVNRDGKVVDERDMEPGPNENRFPDRLEAKLRLWIFDRSALVRQRKALRPKTMVKLLVLATADAIDPNLWDRKGAARHLIASLSNEMPEDVGDMLAPEVVTPQSAGSSLEPPKGEDPVVSLMVRLSKRLQDKGVAVIWVAPPVSKKSVAAEYNDNRNAIYQRAINESGSVLLNYSGLRFRSKHLRDPTHLNLEGRTLFSSILARDVAKLTASGRNGTKGE